MAKIAQVFQTRILTFVWFGFFWGSLLRFREVQKKALWSMHVVLPLELRSKSQSWLWYLSPQNTGGFCWLSNALPGCVGSLAHTRVVSCRVVSCRVVPCRAVPCRAGTALGAGERQEDAITLDSTRPGSDFLLSPCLQPTPKQHKDPRESDEQQTRCPRDSGLEVKPSVIWEGWGFCPLVTNKEPNRRWEWMFLLKMTSKDFKYKTRETETSEHAYSYLKNILKD